MRHDNRPDLEAAVAAAAVLRPELVPELVGAVSADDFTDAYCAAVFVAAVEVADPEADLGTDYGRVHDELRRRGVHKGPRDALRLYALWTEQLHTRDAVVFAYGVRVAAERRRLEAVLVGALASLDHQFPEQVRSRLRQVVGRAA